MLQNTIKDIIQDDHFGENKIGCDIKREQIKTLEMSKHGVYNQVKQLLTRNIIKNRSLQSTAAHDAIMYPAMQSVIDQLQTFQKEY